MNKTMQEQIEFLLDKIALDYERENKDNLDNEWVKTYLQRMRDREILTYSEGKKYIKIIREGSVWGFIVNSHDDKKFKYGDILKAKNWQTPERNQSRGNVFEEYSIKWTGPHYLK